MAATFLRAQLGAGVVDASGLGERGGGAGVVAGEHGDAVDAKAPEALDDCGSSSRPVITPRSWPSCSTMTTVLPSLG